jgi:[ribosomal protein S18]-alanine N-acetyltransferase
MVDWVIERMDIERDLEEVVGLETLCFTNPSTREMFRWEAEKSDVAQIYVLRVNTAPQLGIAGRRILAYCAVWLIFDELHINTLAVHPEWRRQGFAARLLTFVLAEAARRGATKSTLEVRRSNEAARLLYERFGFELRGVRSHYYRNPDEDALILWRFGLSAFADQGRPAGEVLRGPVT